MGTGGSTGSLTHPLLRPWDLREGSTNEPVKAAKAHRWQAVLRRRFPTARASTTCRNPEARVIGAVPA